MNKQEAAAQISKLTAEVKKHNIAYYQKNDPLINDAEYDQLFHRLKTIEEMYPDLASPDSPTQKITPANFAADGFEKHYHVTPMLSLGNAFNQNDVEDFIDRVSRFLKDNSNFSYYLEPKIDGVSISLTYDNGKLIAASTRGDGYIGEDVTENVKTIKSIPLEISGFDDFIEIRGEIFINKDDFAQLNEYQKRNNQSLFANPRNCAAGSLKQLDSSITASRPLRYFVYSAVSSSKRISDSQDGVLSRLRELGFIVNDLGRVANNIQEIIDFYEEVLKTRDQLPYEIDGMVYKINNIQLWDRLGYVGKTPRFAIAHKFPAIIAETRLRDITMQVSRLGTLTPVAELESVNIAGVSVSRASLHNLHEIIRKDIRIGDYVKLQRAGDVIPQIIGVNLDRRPKDLEGYKIPNNCPSCGAEVVFDPDEVNIRCYNSSLCPAQRSRAIDHFVSKGGFDIEGLGKRQVQFLIDRNFISSPVDLFYLEEKNKDSLDKLENQEGWGEKSVNKLFLNINKARKISLDRFIYALGIRNTGDVFAKTIAKEFKSADNFLEQMIALSEITKAIRNNEYKEESESNIYNQLRSIYGIGEKLIIDVGNFFELEQNIEEVRELIRILQIEDYEDISENKPFLGKSIVFTGSLEKISRSEAKAQAEKLGASVKSSVTNRTDLVVAGSSAGSKLKKAEEFGVRVINEDEWLESISTKILL